MIRGFDSVSSIGAPEREALLALPMHSRSVSAHETVMREGDASGQCCVLLSGFFCRHIMVDHGQRQILSFHLPGEVPDLQSLRFSRMDHSIAALTNGEVACVPHAALREAIARAPNLTGVFWNVSLRDASITREWLASTGRRTAYQRIAHLFCEFFVRMSSLGLADVDGFRLPVTQTELADALGLSPVHVNRTLQQMRQDGVIVSRGKYHGFNDWDRLQSVGDFDPTYLHLRTLVA